MSALFFYRLHTMKSASALLLLLSGLFFFSCKPKNELLSTSPNDRLRFSSDSIFFDTVFSSVGSITQRLIVYNPNKSRVRVSSISLAGGSNSAYSIIVNGINGPAISDLDILGNDSIYILIKVLIDPSSQNLPFFVSDSILFNTNSNAQKVLLEAYGQDAHFFKKETIACNAIWTNDKPYVLYDTVSISAGCSLTIKDGCKVYMHNAAALNVSGTLVVAGTSLKPVLIASDKSDKSAEDDLGQWGGLIFQSTSTQNKISWTTIRNSTTAIRLASVIDTDTIAELSLDHVFLLHASLGLIDAAEVDIAGSNVVMSDCPKALLYHAGGCGVWKQCTFANYSSSYFREEPCLLLGKTALVLKMYVFNTILWGDKTDEITASNSSGLFLQSAIWKSAFTGNSVNVINKNPLFTNTGKFDFSLQASSPAINLCTDEGITDDIVATPRDAAPDAGAYEFK